jgi:hypothetical protein
MVHSRPRQEMKLSPDLKMTNPWAMQPPSTPAARLQTSRTLKSMYVSPNVSTPTHAWLHVDKADAHIAMIGRLRNRFGAWK